MNTDWSFKDIISWSAVISSFLVYAAGSKICVSIIRRKTTGDVTLFPFIASLYSGVIWLKYGLLCHLPNLVIASGVNTTCQTLYLIIYYIYTRERSRCGKVILVAAVILYAILIYVKYLTTNDAEAIAKLGLIGMCCTITMCGAPLISLVDVIKSKSTATMDFGFILMNFLSSLLWTYFGFFIRDFNVIVPNGIGGALSALQLSLFVLYPTTAISKDDIKDTEKLERSEGR